MSEDSTEPTYILFHTDPYEGGVTLFEGSLEELNTFIGHTLPTGGYALRDLTLARTDNVPDLASMYNAALSAANSRQKWLEAIKKGQTELGLAEWLATQEA